MTEFLSDYWQKKPVCIRNGVAFQEALIAVDELAGLALEPEVESRLIENNGDVKDWQVIHGPLVEADFNKERDFPWTLLVQGVDCFVPQVHDFLARFRFVPSWRLDDIMISYATQGAGVGAHFDRYDVFLIQGQGQRQWQIGGTCNENSALMAHDQLCLLQNFDVHQEFILNPGDLLYIPPLIAHKGVAMSDACVTYSVGFRSPSYGDVLASFADERSTDISADLRLKDQGFAPKSGEISAKDIAVLMQLMQAQITPENVAQWFGKHSTEAKYPALDMSEEAMDQTELEAIIKDGYGVLRVSEGVRLAYTWQGDGGLTLFVQGEALPCPPDATVFIEAIVNQWVLEVENIAPLLAHDAAKAMLLILHNQGYLYFADE
ncbi:cupin domain-containing protein [Oceanospirillaceae bacterium]|nr:cupin domain-containing protein [Oceanospirillaceae bacterium]MBT4997306.1 cupin domain-containing protein [Oceanospirillaceae bacterium]MBT5628748.1 cupin domain-containing protein [Oceanospirillaceae bacterium]MBT6101952.1 cupin domain-containing protein [Oceanospirillaceae bacterium]MBT7674559.1 cupin domain-containing protein [Oceanospirillaceae bacterium]